MMAKYNLDGLDNDSFEDLVQSLCTGITGFRGKVYGSGPDGQREFTFDNEIEASLFFVNSLKTLYGKTFVQAKYKDSQTRIDDYTWLRKNLKDEMEKFKDKMTTDPGYIPINYLFFTNVKLTPTKDSGIKDKIDKFVNEYNDVIKNIFVLGYDEVCKLLDNNRDVAITYTSYICPGDILQKILSFITFNEANTIETLMTFLEKEFIDDTYSRMEQAGMQNERKITLENVFIDIHATTEGNIDTKEKPYFVQSIVASGNSVNRFTEDALLRENIDHVKNNKTLSMNRNKYVLIGSAGQGKSTLNQFLCQIYRAYFLKNHDNNYSEDIHEFIEVFENDYGYPIKCLRIPIRIVLNDYAEWISLNVKSINISVNAYILSRIKMKTNQDIHISDFNLLLKTYSWLFIFDGLDEVSTYSNREKVLLEINSFIETDLRRNNCDYLVIATSRPQGYSEDFDSKKYLHLQLNEMTKDVCITYIKKLLNCMEDNFDKKNEYLRVLSKVLEDPMISKLMCTPLQTTIMTILVKSGGEPPRDRYNLYNDFYNTIINREKQKNLIEKLNESLCWIDDIHYKLAFTLLLNSEKDDNQSATFNKPQMVSLIKKYIQEQDYENNGIDGIDDRALRIFDIIVKRITFITEIQSDKYGFPIRSIQEFLAARYITTNQPDKNIIRNLEVVSTSSYWRNVVLFMMGAINKSSAHLIGQVDSICGQKNGSSKDLPNGLDISKMGSWLALDILIDGSFKSRPKYENIFFKYICRLMELEITPNHNEILKLPEYIIENLINNCLKDKLLILNRSSWYIVGILYKNRLIDNKIIIENFPQNEKEIEAILHVIINNVKIIDSYNYEKDYWIYERICEFIKNSNINLYLSLSQYNVLSRFYIDAHKNDEVLLSRLLKNIIHCNHMTEYYLNNTDTEYIDKLYNNITNDLFKQIVKYNFETKNINIKNLFNLSFTPIIKMNHNYDLKLFKRYNLEYIYDYFQYLTCPTYENMISFLLSIKKESNEIQQRLLLGSPFRNNWFMNYFYDQYLRNNDVDSAIDFINRMISRDSDLLILDKKLSMLFETYDGNFDYLKQYIRFFRINDIETQITLDILNNTMREFELLSNDMCMLNVLKKEYLFQIFFALQNGAENINISKEAYNGLFELYQTFDRKESQSIYLWRLWKLMIFYLIDHLDITLILERKIIYEEWDEEFIYFPTDNKPFYERVIEKIYNMVLLSAKEIDAMSLLPNLLSYSRPKGDFFNQEKVYDIYIINCNNSYNNFGKLVICIFSDPQDSQLKDNIKKDFHELLEKHTDKIMEIIITILETDGIKSTFEEEIAVELYLHCKKNARTHWLSQIERLFFTYYSSREEDFNFSF